MNKNKFFYSYKYELNFLATHNDINKFDKYHYTILEYIKNDLGPKYKFRNYKISGPNFSKIEFDTKKIKNISKTDYIRSKSTLTFTIFSMNKNNLDLIREKIKISYPEIMHVLNSLDLINYISLIDFRISTVCGNIISNIDNSICNDFKDKINYIRELTIKINPSHVNTESISAENLNNLNKIIKTSKDLKTFFEDYYELKEKYPLHYIEILNLLENLNDISPESVVKKKSNNYKLIKLVPKYDYYEISYVNKIFVYINLIIILLIFIFYYLKIIFKK